ncbi:hypothetical protein HHX47_DHR3000385 [Lentinula edodes]|nr:hypothetical protein HHX47_DHR3000385 [Lentinula edodes]
MLQVQRNAFGSTNFLKSARKLRRSLQTKHVKRPPLGFAFDIDGVLMGGPEPLPKARNALRILNGDNPLNAKIPYILISPSQIIQAHTILKDYVDQYADKAVLCLGGIGDTMRKVAESYGYRKAYTTTDVLAWNSSPTYDYARRVLQNLLEESYGPGELPHMYMIGDNPESDIAGANAAGWSSILVHTGVYDPTTGPPTHIPSQEARDVEEAVIWALERTLRSRP